MKEEMTWGELFKLFVKRNKDFKRINDYRPAGRYKMQIWLKDGTTFYAEWIPEREEFAIMFSGR